MPWPISSMPGARARADIWRAARLIRIDRRRCLYEQDGTAGSCSIVMLVVLSPPF
ncbi:MAG TPA: hypothetical protein VGG62_06225 [Terracidiphilus sp.]